MTRAFSVVVVCGCFALPAFAADPAKLDRDGVPLPKGAEMRIGTLRSRAPISDFGIEKDGTIVTVGPEPSVRRWRTEGDTSTEPISLRVQEKDTSGNNPRISPDGKYVVGYTGQKITVWETPTDAKAKPKELATFEHSYTGGFSPDSSKLFVATRRDEGDALALSCFLYSVKTKKKIELEGTFEDTRQVAFSGDGKHVGMQVLNRFAFWNAETGKLLADFPIDDQSIEGCALNQTGDLLVAKSYQVQADAKAVWYFIDPKTGKKRDDMTGPQGGKWVSFAPKDKTLLVGDENGVQWWDPVAKKLLRRFEGAAPSVPARFSSDGKTLIAASGAVLFRWEVETGKPLFESQNAGHADDVLALGVSPDGKRIATYAWDHRVCVWDAGTGKQLWEAPAYPSYARRLDFSPDGKVLYVPGERWDEIYKRDAATGKVLQKYTPDSKMEPGLVYSIRASSDGKTVSALIGSPSILTWNTESGKLLKTSEAVSNDSWIFDISPDEAFFVTSNADHEGLVRPVADQSVNHLKDVKFRIRRVGEFSSDGKWLTLIASTSGPAGELYSAAVISTKTWKVANAVPVAQDGRMAISPDGSTLAVSHDERLEFYAVETGKLIGGYDIPAGDWKRIFAFTCVLRFTPDGTKLITGHSDTTALVWPVPKRPAK